MVDIKNGEITLVCENKVASAIYKVIRTQFDDYALACSGGLFFAKYEPSLKKFVKAPDFFLSDHLVTQVHEVSSNMFAVGIWGVPWVGLVDKRRSTLIKMECPLEDETQCTDLLLLPGFNYRTFPFLLMRNSKAINLVNLANFSVHRLLTQPNQAGSFQKTVLHVQRAFESTEEEV